MLDRSTRILCDRLGQRSPFTTVGNLILFAGFGLAVSPLFGQPAPFPDPKFWVPDGPVNAIVVTNGTAYFAGDFSYVGPRTGPAAMFDEASGQTFAGLPMIAGLVKAVQPDGSGGWFIGGTFTNIGGTPITNVAHLHPNLALDRAWHAGLVGSAVNALVLDGGSLYIGGSFSRLGGQPITGLGAVSALDGSLSSWNPQFSGSVNAMQIANSLLYVGGNFFSVGSSNRGNLAAIATDKTALANAWNPQADLQVLALFVSGSTVYVGGQFATVGTKPRNYLAALDATTGVATSWNPNPNKIVRALAASGTAVYVGGDFTTIGGHSKLGFAAVNNANGAALSLDLQLQSAFTTSLVRSLALDATANSLYVGGSFTNANGALHPLLVGLNLASSETIPTPSGTDFNGTSGADVGANAIAIANGKVLVAGNFVSLGGVARQRAAALSTTTGAALPWAPVFDAPVMSLAYGPNGIYAGGLFTNIYSNAVVVSSNSFPILANGLALIDPVSGNPVPGFAFQGTNTSFGTLSVNALAVSAGTLYAGGSFTAVSGQPRRFLAALDPAAGDLIPTFNASLSGGFSGISSLVLAGSSLYVAGDFTTVAGASLPKLAALSPDDGSAVNWTPAPNQAVTVLAASSDTLYVGGTFTQIGGLAFRNLAAFSLADNSLQPVDASMDKFSSGVTAMSATPTTLYVAGSFASIGGAFEQNLASLASFNASAYQWNPAPDVPPSVIALTEDDAFIGGDFRYLGQSPTNMVSGFLAVFSRAPQLLSITLADPNTVQIITTTGDFTDAVIQSSPSPVKPVWTDVATNGAPGFWWTQDLPVTRPGNTYFRAVGRQY